MLLGSSILAYAVDAPGTPQTTGGARCKPCALAARGTAGGKERADNIAGTLSDDSIKALAGLTTSTDECAEGVDHAKGTPCASKKILNVFAAFVAANPAPDIKKSANSAPDLLPTANTSESAIVREVAGILGCPSESCIIAHPDIHKFVVERRLATPHELELELGLRFKAPGPRNSLALLSNYNLDETLQRWGRVFTEFFPCPFAMMDFDSNGDYFGEANFPAILQGRAEAELGSGVGRVRRKSSCFGCIVNTDTSRGPGKHWVAVFVDCRPPPGEPWTVEYFNSAGRPPPKPMVGWMERTRAQLAEYRSGRPENRNTICEAISVPVTDMDHQESQTECGLYALFYIRRRLEGVPYTFFEQQLVPDEAMTTFREHVFRSG